MLVKLRVIADGAVDAEQAVISLAIVVHHEIRGDVRRVGWQLQRPRVGNVQVTHAVFVGIGKGARQQQGGHDEGVLEHGESPFPFWFRQTA